MSRRNADVDGLAVETDGATREIVLSEERLSTGTTTEQAGRVRARKAGDVENVSMRVERGTEHADLERVAAIEGDSGLVETLEDGSISIPVFEEQIVVEKRLVVRERVVLRKHTVYEEHKVTADLRRERLEVDVDGDVRVTEAGDGTAAGTAGGSASATTPHVPRVL